MGAGWASAQGGRALSSRFPVAALPALERGVSGVLLGPRSSCCAPSAPAGPAASALPRRWRCVDGGLCRQRPGVPLGLSRRGGLRRGALKSGGAAACRAPPSCASPALPDRLRLSLTRPTLRAAGHYGQRAAAESHPGVVARRSPTGAAPSRPAGRGPCLPCPRLLVALRRRAPDPEPHGGPSQPCPAGRPPITCPPGLGGPLRERLRCTASWEGGGPRGQQLGCISGRPLAEFPPIFETSVILF